MNKDLQKIQDDIFRIQEEANEKLMTAASEKERQDICEKYSNRLKQLKNKPELKKTGDKKKVSCCDDYIEDFLIDSDCPCEVESEYLSESESDYYNGCDDEDFCELTIRKKEQDAILDFYSSLLALKAEVDRCIY